MVKNILVAPTVKNISHTFEHQGKTYSDDYRWLHDKNDAEVIAYLEAENEYARACLQHTEELQETLFKEMRGRIQEDDSSVPVKRGNYFYYWRIAEGQQYRVFCRKQGSLDSEEEVLIDENSLAENLEYCRINHFAPSPDNNLLAYSVDTTGSFVYNLYIMDMNTGEQLVGSISDTAWSIAWASDNKTLFYSVFDDAHRAYQVRRHQVGHNSEDDAIIYQEDDDSFDVSIERSSSGEYILMGISSHSTGEVHFLAANQPLGDFQVIHPRQHWLEYDVEHHGNRFLIRMNEDAENFKIMEAPVDNPSKENWQALIPHRENVLVTGIHAFQDYLVISERKNGFPQIRIAAPDDVSNSTYVNFPEPVYTVQLASNPTYDTKTLRFVYNSLITPTSVVDYDMVSAEWDIKKRQEIPSGYDESLYTSERLLATAADGTQVPISLIYRKDLKRDGSNPTLLYGYGSYGYSMEASFSTMRLSLVDRGFIFAIAHIRGGSEMGRSWYEQGRLMHKKNTFTDFIACAEHLIAENYTSSEKLAIMGGSAGGLLVTAVTNMRPDLFKAVVAMVPFTNVITAMMMPELPLTVVEWEQWGNPEKPEEFDYMLTYSPYENIEAKDYPHLYVKAGLNDLQVPYWDPAKWVAKLRTHKTDDNRLLLITNMGAGHHGSSGRYDFLREYTQVYAFLIDTLDV